MVIVVVMAMAMVMNVSCSHSEQSFSGTNPSCTSLEDSSLFGDDIKVWWRWMLSGVEAMGKTHRSDTIT